jgi:integrase/recombinase XerD
MWQYDKYFESLKIDKSEETVRNYKTAIDGFLEYFSIQDVSDIEDLDQEDIQDYLNFLVTKVEIKDDDEDKESKLNKVKASTNARYRSIKAFINWLKSRNYIENVDMIKVHRFKEGKGISRFLDTEERDKIILATKKRPGLQLMMMIMFYTGLRCNEAINVKTNDIRDGILTVCFGKGNIKREIALPPFVVDMINDNLSKRKFKSEYLFISMRGGHKISTGALRLRVKTACKMAGYSGKELKEISAHTIRRSFACNLLLAGESSFTIKELLGHRSILTTERYIEPAKKRAAKEASLRQSAPSWYTND